MEIRQHTSVNRPSGGHPSSAAQPSPAPAPSSRASSPRRSLRRYGDDAQTGHPLPHVSPATTTRIPPQPTPLSQSLRRTLQTHSGAGFSKLLASLDATRQPRACSHRLSFVRPAKPVGSAAARIVPSMHDAWWGQKAAHAVAAKRQLARSLMSVKATAGFKSLLMVRGGGRGETRGDGDPDGGGGRGAGLNRSDGGGGGGGGGVLAAAVEPVMRVTDVDLTAHREHVRTLRARLKPAYEAAEVAAQALAEKADEMWEAACEELAAARVGEHPEAREYSLLTKIKRPTRVNPQLL